MYFVIFLFKSRYRYLALNNLVKSKLNKNLFIINLSGPILFLLGYLLYKILISKRFLFVSCDGNPFLKDRSRSVNLWMGGTNFKIFKNYRQFKNNKVVASNIFSDRSYLMQLYPENFASSFLKKDFKFIFLSKVERQIDSDVIHLWKKNKHIILKKFSLVDNINFWKNNFKENIDNKARENKYIQLKLLLRKELIIQFYSKFKKNFLVIGSDWTKYIGTAIKDIYDLKVLKKYYEGNICIDLGAKDGDEIFYPRSIQVMENGGLFLQAKQKIFNNKIKSFYDPISFDSIDEMFKKTNFILNNPKKFEEDFNKFSAFIRSNNFNYKNLVKLFR
jgi:hypothetical protein